MVRIGTVKRKMYRVDRRKLVVCGVVVVISLALTRHYSLFFPSSQQNDHKNHNLNQRQRSNDQEMVKHFHGHDEAEHSKDQDLSKHSNDQDMLKHSTDQNMVRFQQQDSDNRADSIAQVANNGIEVEDSGQDKKSMDTLNEDAYDPDNPDREVEEAEDADVYEALDEVPDVRGLPDNTRQHLVERWKGSNVDPRLALRLKDVLGQRAPEDFLPRVGDLQGGEADLLGKNSPGDEPQNLLNLREPDGNPVEGEAPQDLLNQRAQGGLGENPPKDKSPNLPNQQIRDGADIVKAGAPVENLAELNPKPEDSVHVEGAPDKDGGPYSDSPMLKAAYWRSPCSALSDTFVGSDPLFPPCLPSISPGVAKWGKYPYIGPFNYIKESKNPCFYDDMNRIRCVPYFFQIGFSKCGTSDLYARLIQHPQIVGTNKEMKWYSRHRFPQYYYEEVESFDKYLQYFNGLAFGVKNEIAAHGFNKKIVGDYSVQAVNEVFEWPQLAGNEGCTEPRVINANHIAHLNPNIKIIVIMREPVQRLYSRFLYDYNRATLNDYRRQEKVDRSLRTPEMFHQFVVDGLAKYEACFQTQSLRHCVYNRTLWETVHGLKIQDSLYAVLLEDWLRVIPRDRFLFLRTEDFKKDIRGYMEKIFNFLELDPIPEERMQKICNAEQKMVGAHNTGPMLPETQARLSQFFAPFVNRLAQLLDDPKFLWKDL